MDTWMQIASWVAQASFEPLGLTVAVAKDRAIESLMQVGDAFVLNCLGEGEYGPLMKVHIPSFCSIYWMPDFDLAHIQPEFRTPFQCVLNCKLQGRPHMLWAVGMLAICKQLHTMH